MALSPQERQQRLALLAQELRRRGVDVKAAMAVFGREGVGGGIGDAGHAFGPGQFNDAGGVWTGRYPGLSAEQKNAVAWSPGGLSELAERVAAVSKGLSGAAAIKNIVYRFERPRDKPGEVSGALRAYGLPAGPGGSSLGAASAPAGTTGGPQSLSALSGPGNTRSSAPGGAQQRMAAGLALLANWHSPYSALVTPESTLPAGAYGLAPAGGPQFHSLPAAAGPGVPGGNAGAIFRQLLLGAGRQRPLAV
jgi:hypothetical protein